MTLFEFFRSLFNRSGFDFGGADWGKNRRADKEKVRKAEKQKSRKADRLKPVLPDFPQIAGGDSVLQAV
jgi:hypothetical protein